MKTASIVQAKRKLRSLGRTVLVLLLFVSVLFSGRLQATAAGKVDASVKVDLAATKQIIRGFGAASAWCGSISDTNMDILFKDMGLSILRVRIAPSEIWKAAPVLVDSGWTVELYNAKKASARGAIVIATPWTPPASMKTNNSLVGGELKPEEYANYAQYLKAFGLLYS